MTYAQTALAGIRKTCPQLEDALQEVVALIAYEQPMVCVGVGVWVWAWVWVRVCLHVYVRVAYADTQAMAGMHIYGPDMQNLFISLLLPLPLPLPLPLDRKSVV